MFQSGPRLNQQTTDELLKLHAVASSNGWDQVLIDVMDVLEDRVQEPDTTGGVHR